MPVKRKQVKREYWKSEEEELLKQWADKSQCYQWMHMKARQAYQRKNAMYTIPVIIISTITGTANFAQERFSEDLKPYVAMGVGTMSIIAGIITTIYQFLKISELNESHRVASLSWGKFYRDINAELIRHPLDRIPADEFIKNCKEEYNRLVEISPFIPKKILANFQKKFNKNTALVKPEIGDIINATEKYKMDPEDREQMVAELNLEITRTNKILQEKVDQIENKKDQFRNSFFNLNQRYPTEEELENNIKYIEEEEDESADATSLEEGQVPNLKKIDSKYLNSTLEI
jgi:hypothetical protein